MSAPGIVRVKRRRSEAAPQLLVVEPSSKRIKNVHYILQSSYDQGISNAQNAPNTPPVDSSRPEIESGSEVRNNGAAQPTDVESSSLNSARPERRTFHMGSVKKRKNGDHGVATFMEKRARTQDPDEVAQEQTAEFSNEGKAPSPERFKRPTARRVASKTLQPATQPAASKQEVESLADSLYQFALEQSAKEALKKAKPKVTHMPRISGQRSREIHNERVAAAAKKAAPSNTDDGHIRDEDGDYVFDTYVLASAGAGQVAAQDDLENIGYIILTEEDEETFMDVESSDKDWNSEEEDENAEDWYGADYPEAELSSDDEFDKNAFKYHSHEFSDDDEVHDEDWDDDGDGQSWSEDEYERQMSPWRAEMASLKRQMRSKGQ